ncbi:MAG: HAD hydrolase family protein [Nitrospinae bacterium]|nr:HAD hydrolase family protein [Nitrospinota bacterium]
MIEAVFLDIDGILTDGAVYVDSSGNETKRILFDDIDAVFEMKRAGLKVGFITGEDNSFCEFIQKRFAPEFFVSGCKDKLGALKQILTETGMVKSQVCYAGDSKKDVPLLEFLPLSFVPSDVDNSIKASAKIALKTPRGHGVIKEIAMHILKK